MPERAVPASQHNHLHPLRDLNKDVDHHIQPGIVRIDERVVQDQGHRLALGQQEVGERNPRQHGQLLLGAARKVLTAFAQPCALHCFQLQVLREPQLAAGQQAFDVTLGPLGHRPHELRGGFVARLVERVA